LSGAGAKYHPRSISEVLVTRLFSIPRLPTAVLLITVFPTLVGLGGCRQIGLAPDEVDGTAVREETTSRQPDHVVVQHVLIAHEGAEIAGVTRSIDQARTMAATVLQKARAGDDFDELVRLYGDDGNSSAVYAISNFGVTPATAEGVERVGLVRGFGDLAFSLQPDEVGLVEYDAVRSPHGFHVVKRLR